MPISLPRDREIVCEFRRDSYIVSFGNDLDYPGDSEYLRWLASRIAEFPDGFMLLTENGSPIGQIELQIKLHSGRRRGRINLYYLTAGCRGKGIGTLLDSYAMNFFRRGGVSDCYLHVSSSNKPAVAFYSKAGFREAAREESGRVILMEKAVH